MSGDHFFFFYTLRVLGSISGFCLYCPNFEHSRYFAGQYLSILPALAIYTSAVSRRAQQNEVTATTATVTNCADDEDD